MTFTILPLQEVESVVPKVSLDKSEEEQLHPLRKRQKPDSEEEEEATSASQQVGDSCILIFDLLHS